jgi:hypothetical protein
MSLNTNGWDYIHTITLQKLNEKINGLILAENFIALNDTINATIGDFTHTIVIEKLSKFNVEVTSYYNVLDISMNFNGTYKIDSTNSTVFYFPAPARILSRGK